MKVGDTVRYLNAVGGGKVTRIDGKIAYVEEDGFETPTLIKDLVVVMPANYETPIKGAKVMFDQKAFEAGKSASKEIVTPTPAAPSQIPEKYEETAHGNKLNILLAFEPTDIKNLSKSQFNAVLINDSNYFLSFAFLRRGGNDRQWTLVYADTIAPNEIMDLATYSYEELPDIERVAIQAAAFKKRSEFELKAPINAVKKLNLTKFYKLHCFNVGPYLDSPVIEVPLMRDDVAAGSDVPAPNPEKLAEAMTTPNKEMEKELRKKFKVDSRRDKKQPNPEANPHKLLPLIEIDLHIGELTDNTNGMSNADMLGLQVDTVKKTMEKHCRRIGQKIVFIHGKGDGVLRKAVLEFLKKNYPKAELQDASFREYGFGATLVTIH